MPRERRLVVDGVSVTLETELGVRNILLWSECQAVLLWTDRAELVLGDRVSLVVRAADWHRGAGALQAIRRRAPQHLVVPMHADPEPEPDVYVLRGMPAMAAPILYALLLLGVVLGLTGLSIGLEEQQTGALVIGVPFLALALASVRALVRRFRVPRRWREAAVVRGHAGVRVDSSLAGATDRALRAAEPALFAAAGGLFVLLLVMQRGFWPWVLPLALAFAVRRERERRARRTALPPTCDDDE